MYKIIGLYILDFAIMEGTMRLRNTEREQEALKIFKEKMIMTIPELTLLLQCSSTTVRRRLKEWNAYTSYNKNGRYYTLPSIPRFSKKGLWEHQGICFSKYGTLKSTIIHFVRASAKGLSNSGLAEIIGINPHSFMPQFKELAELNRERYGRQIVYYSSEEQVYKEQKERRFPPAPPTQKLPPDAVSIVILVERIRNPKSSELELSHILAGRRHKITEEAIHNLLEYHGLLKKTPDT